MHSLDATSSPKVDIFKELTPLTEEPFNKHPYSTREPNTNHFGWVTQLSSLIKLEKSLDIASIDYETLEKVQAAFDEFVESMIAFGFNVNKDLVWQNCKPLHTVARKGCFLILTSLIRKGADINAYCRDGWGQTPLHDAAFSNQLAAAQVLIRSGADINKPSVDVPKDTLPLHVATSPEMCSLLVRSGTSVNAVGGDAFRASALHWNAHCLRPDTIATLLELGARDFEHPSIGSALDVAKKVHTGVYTVMMGGVRDETLSQKVIDLLTPAAE